MTHVDPHAAAEARLEGAPQVPAEARVDLLALKSGSAFACLRRNGDIAATQISGEGLYDSDTRHLSTLRLTLGSVLPVPLSAATRSGHLAIFNATNPTLWRDGEMVAPQETVNVRRTVLIADRLYYEVQVRSFHSEPIELDLELELEADFADVFDVRGIERRSAGRLLEPHHEDGVVRFAYVGVDDLRRETSIELDPPPTELSLRDGAAHAAWAIALRPREATTLLIAIECLPAPRPRQAPPMSQQASLLEDDYERWTASCAQVVTDNDLFDRLIEASLRDLYALLMPAPGGTLPAAGIPWYVAPFGRDSLLTASEALMINPEIARSTLLVLAGLQATDYEPWRDAEPGKILHELRVGELARARLIPHTPYYGSVDSTPLFLMLAGAYLHWTRDLETLELLRPALLAALDWLDGDADLDGDGLVEYERRSGAGLLNQGWKDSEDAIVHLDGTLAEGPIALAEVQGYVYEAKLCMSELMRQLGEPDRAETLRRQADELRVAFNERFWDPEQQFFALALDGRKRQVRTITSNPAHCLYCGIVDDDKAAPVAERLMASDMYSGWGIRTMSTSARAYNPMSYHNGSVWPHDNAIAAAGLKRYGFHAAAARIAGGLLDVAAAARDFRLPELFCGFHRDQSQSVVNYPVACSPQAWAAAAPFMLVQAMLGITADGPTRTLRLDRPTLPEWLEHLELRNVRLADARVSLAFHRSQSGTTGFSLLDQEGEARVTMSA